MTLSFFIVYVVLFIAKDRIEGVLWKYGFKPYFLFFCFLLLSPEEEVGYSGEVLLHYNTQALRVKTVACKVAVVGLVVHVYGKVAVRE